ncbi:ABC transporter permease [Pontibacillus yanchengensis]|uniref:Permease n=1 Tax=Pontibacillus yanchengensis Y32 TaxID=1385514 RepID=A0A0A2TGS3_9BACI|nr:ABC transporter permease [Pontibacillus yanchengensis]KGP73316.1 permease [Pontibacillus yanchengensis Y32]
MFLRLLKADLVKCKRSWMWFLLLLGPIGIVGLQAVNFGLRYDYLTDVYADDLWEGLLSTIQMFSPPVILLGMAIITSMLAGLEHDTNAWKQLLANPIHKHALYWSKCVIGIGMLLVSCLVLAIGSLILGLALSFGTDIPWAILMKSSFLPFLAASPFFILQIWLAVTFKNQSVAITTGVLGAAWSTYSSMLPIWNPVSWPSLYNEYGIPLLNVGLGLGLALILGMLSTLDFVRKDVMH